MAMSVPSQNSGNGPLHTLSSHLLGITHMHFLLPPALELLDSINTILSVVASSAIIIVCLSRFLINNLAIFF